MSASAAAYHTLELVENFKSACVWVSACDLEVFDALDGKPATAKALAGAKGWNEDACRRLFDGLVAIGYLTKQGGDSGDAVYSNAPPGELMIRSKNPNLWGMSQHIKRAGEHFIRSLTHEVQSGAHKADEFPSHVSAHTINEVEKSAKAESGHHHHGHHHGHGHHHHGDQDEKKLLERYRMMDSNGVLFAQAAVTAFDLSKYKSVVDLGGGSGVLCRALVDAYPAMEVNMFEVPLVTELVLKHFLPEKYAKINLVAGDFMSDELPAADLYLLCKIVHDWRPDQVDFLINKVFNATNSGGAIILMEKCLTDDKDGPCLATNWDLFVMSHCGGNLRSGAEYTALLEKHGFRDVKIHKAEDLNTFDVIYATKP